MTSKGFDELFNDSSFTVSRALSKGKAPAQWPKSASEMRSHTSFSAQGIASIADSDGYHDYKKATMGGPKARAGVAAAARRMPTAPRAPPPYTSRPAAGNINSPGKRDPWPLDPDYAYGAVPWRPAAGVARGYSNRKPAASRTLPATAPGPARTLPATAAKKAPTQWNWANSSSA